jgi:hypothetical protein
MRSPVLLHAERVTEVMEDAGGDYRPPGFITGRQLVRALDRRLPHGALPAMVVFVIVYWALSS